MEESIFDLQTDILNLIKERGFSDEHFAFVYTEGRLMIIDLKQPTIEKAVEEKINKVLQDDKEKL